MISFIESLGKNNRSAIVISNEKTDCQVISSLLGGRVKFVKLKNDNPVSDQFLIPLNILRKTSVYFSIYPKFPVILPFLGVKVFVIIADMINFSISQKIFLKVFGKLPYRVITISDTWKKKIDRFIGKNTVRVYCDISYMEEKSGRNLEDKQLDKDELKMLGIEPGKYLLYVGNFNPHKNIKNLILAFKIVREKFEDLQLVLAGGGGKNEQKFDVPPECKIIRFPDDALLKKLYMNAFAFVLPSFQEGLGIPLIEAAYFAKPILASDIDIFRETAGDCALFFDPNSPKDISDKILILRQNSSLRKSMEEKSRKIAEKFSSFKTGDILYEIVFGKQ